MGHSMGLQDGRDDGLGDISAPIGITSIVSNIHSLL